jgi:hypothetical protein
VTLATDLLAWMGMLALTGHDARRWEPKRLRHRLFSIPASIALVDAMFRSSARSRELTAAMSGHVGRQKIGGQRH